MPRPRIFAALVAAAVVVPPAGADAAAPGSGTWVGTARDTTLSFVVDRPRRGLTTVRKVVVVVDDLCGPGSGGQFTARTTPVSSKGTFTATATGAKPLTLKGRVTSTGQIRGTLGARDIRNRSCVAPVRSFTAKLGGPQAPAGRRVGATTTGSPLSFFVASHGLTVGSYAKGETDRRFTTRVVQPCSGGQASAIDTEVSITRPMRIDPLGRFEGTQELGDTTVEVTGQLRPDGTASGTARAITSSELLGTCDSGPVAWTAGPAG